MSQRHLGDGDFSVDANGCLTERVESDGLEVIIHYDDIPESDVTTVDGLRCTTPLRTVIDLAAELEVAELDTIVRDCLQRKLFTPAEAIERVTRPDIRNRPGALALRRYFEPPAT